MYLLAPVQGWAAGSLIHGSTARRGRQQGQGVQDGVFRGDHAPMEISFTGHLETRTANHSRGPPVFLLPEAVPGEAQSLNLRLSEATHK